MNQQFFGPGPIRSKQLREVFSEALSGVADWDDSGRLRRKVAPRLKTAMPDSCMS